MLSRFLLLASVALFCAVPAVAQQQAAPAPTPANDDDNDIVVTARRLDQARDTIQASLGASEFTFNSATLANQPGGVDRALSAVLLQAPGVTQDGDDEIHIRNEHGNIQYRLNGIIVPESIAGFGQTFDQSIAQSIELITGTLPAQYGYRTAGVVNLRTRSGDFDDAGEIGFTGGSNGLINPSAHLFGGGHGLSYFASASYSQSDLGIENPLPTRSALHDRSQQYRGFGYVSDIISDDSRLTFFGGVAIGQFQIPNVPGQQAAYVVNGRTSADSAQLDLNQREWTYYGVAAYQYAGDTLDVQIAPFVRYSRTRFVPDAAGGDILFNGFADTARLSSLVAGVQADAAWETGAFHTIRFGVFAQNERTQNIIVSRVLPVDGNGNQTSDQLRTIIDNGGINGQLYGVYVQDEWAITPHLTLNYGVRFDAVRAYVSEEQLSPRVNLVWTAPGGSTIFHAGFARNFTPPPQELIGAPTLALYAGTTKASANTVADPVRSERENYYDMGVQQRLATGLTVALDAYYKDKHYLLDEGQFGSALVNSPFNYERGYAWGVELRADYEHGPVSLYANAARGEQRARNIVSSQYFFDSAELNYIANSYIFTDHSQAWTASAGGSVRIDNGMGQLVPAFDLIYGDGLRTDDPAGIIPNGGKLPGYVSLNLGLGQTFTRPGPLHDLSLRVDVSNLLDKVYLIRDGSGVGVGAPQYGARRAVMVSIHKEF